MDEIYEAMRETVAIKDGDRFMAIAEHGEHEFAYGRRQTHDVQEDRRAARNQPWVRPEDVLISVVETAAENWSFGNGETQFYEPRVAA
jgi:hypothetical protein